LYIWNESCFILKRLGFLRKIIIEEVSMKKIFLSTVIFCTIICIGWAGQANASVVINNSYSGWYDDSGNHSYSNENYYSGAILAHS